MGSDTVTIKDKRQIQMAQIRTWSAHPMGSDVINSDEQFKGKSRMVGKSRSRRSSIKIDVNKAAPVEL